MGKGKKKQAKNKKETEPEDDTVQQMPSEEAAPQETAAIDDAQADSLVVVEVFESRTHNKLSADQQLVTVFDGEDMYQVVTDQPVQQDDLVVYAKPGCVIPGTQQRVGNRKVNGVKSQGHICNAYEVGWQEEPTHEYLRIDEEWNMISGDVCPMGPPQGWVLQNAARLAEASNDDANPIQLREGSDGDLQEASRQDISDSSPAKGAVSSEQTDDSADDVTLSQQNGEAKPKGTGGTGVNAFMGLVGSDASESESEEDVPDKTSKGLNAFAGLMGTEEEEDEEDGEEEEGGEHETPKASAAKAKAVNAFAGLMGSGSDDSEEEEEDDQPAQASRNSARISKAANVFAGLMDRDEADDAEDSDEDDTPRGTGTAGDAKAVSAFAGLMGDGSTDDDAETEQADSSPVVNTKKSSAAGAFAALLDDGEDDSDDGEVAADVQQISPEIGTPLNDAEKEKSEAGHSLLDLPIDAFTTAAQVQEAMAIEGISKTRKQKLKQRLKKLQDAEGSTNASAVTQQDPASMPVDELATVEQVEAAMNAPNISKTRKQKLKQRLKALQEEAAGDTVEPQGTAANVDVPVESLSTVEEVQAALNDPKTSKTRKQKLKQRLKQLQDSANKPKGKKVSAAVAAMQREVEERRKAEEAARQEQEEQRRAEEEAILQAELETKRKEEAEQARAEAKRLEREKLRKEGKLLTAKQRAEAKRLAAQREMFLARAQEVGITTGDKPTPAQLEERRRQARKRQKELEEQRAREKEAAEQAERERKRQAEKEAEALRRKEAEAAALAEAAAEEAAADNWEDEVPDEWDASDDQDDDGEGAGSQKLKDDDVVSNVSENEEGGTEGSTEEDSSEEDSSDEDSSSDWSTDSDEERERRLEEARARREARFKEAMGHRSKDDLRSPICCILGHVDTGKTKILDNIRRTNVQTGEAGGITQQIGATYIPADAVKGRTEDLRKGKSFMQEFDMKMPGLLVIDTPGHESFSNLRSRGSSLCDIAVLVVDIMHGLEQQTIESINLLKMRKSPFIIALNKIDRMYNWQPHENAPVRDSLSKQEKATQEEFDTRCRDSMLALNEQGLNVELYWKNKDPRRFVNIVPTSAITGEGICDLMWLIVKLTQSMMMDRLMFVEELQCTVLEVKVVEGYGHTIDAVLINGRIREGDKVVICGLQGPIVTTVRSLLTPHPLKELRVKNTYIHHKEIKAAQGIKISAPNLESAVAGTQLFVVGKADDEEELKDLVMEDMSDIFDKKEPEGVCVQASTLGSLEALLEFLGSDAVQIPVSGINIGPVHKKDIMRANVMNEKKLKKFSCILAFDVPITREAQALAQSLGVTIFAADIIYHLFDMFTEYTQRCKAEEKSAAATKAVFPCRMRIVPNCIFNAKDPIVLGCEVIEGQLRMGTPITVPAKDCDLGKVIGLEKDHKAVEVVERGESVAVKIEATNSVEASKLVGRHFVESDELASKISRESIDALKAHFRDEMTRPMWELVIKLKKVFKID